MAFQKLFPAKYKEKSPILSNDIYTLSIIGTLLKTKISRYAMWLLYKPEVYLRGIFLQNKVWVVG